MLKNKRTVRRLAWLLCLSLIVGILPIGMISVPVEVNAVPAETVNLIANGDFENGTDGWKNAQLNEMEGRTGSALQVDSNVKGKDLETANDSRPAITAGASYDFSFYAKRDAADDSGKKITAYVLWYDANGAYMTGKANYWDVGPGAEWKQYQYSVTAPAGAAAAAVRFYGSSGFDGLIYIDDVVFVNPNGGTSSDTEPTQTTEATEAISANLMVNGDFEDGTAGWPTSNVLTSCTDDKHGGNASLKFTDNNDTAGGPYFQQVIPVEAGKTYKLTAWVKVLEGKTGYIGVYGIGSASKQLAFGAAGEWKLVEITVTVPADKTEAKIEIGANSGSAATYLLDDVAFVEVISAEPVPSETTAPTETTVPTETTAPAEFEGIFVDFVDGAAIPDVSEEQWKEYNGDEETVLTKESNMYKVGRGGNNKLVFQAGVKNVQYYAKSPVFAIEGGKDYTVRYQAAWYFSNAVNGTLEFVFVDANGNALATKTADAFKAAADQGAWADVLVSGNAPEAAVGAYLKFSYCVTGKSYDYWIRNLAVVEGVQEEEPTEPTQSTQPTDPAPTSAAGDLVNGGFEDGTAGWPSSSVLSSCTDDKHSGNASLKFTDNNDTAGGPYFQQTVAVEAGKTYKLSAWVKVLEGGSGYIGVYGIGSNNKAVTMGVAGEWKQIAVIVTIPEDKAEAKIEIGANSGSAVTFLLDDMEFVQTDPDETLPTETTAPTETTPTETTVPPELEGIFVDFVDGAAIPDVSVEQWKEYNGDEETVLTKESNMYKVGRGGNNKLVFQGGVKNVQYYAKSPVFAIEGGKGYTAGFEAAWYFNNAVIGTLEIVFVDANGNVLDTLTGNAFDPEAEEGAWDDMLISGTAPEAAVGAYLKFNYCVTDKSYDYWIRNLVVTEGIREEEPTEPKDPNLMLEDHFEKFVDSKNANSGPVGWYSSDDAQGIYSVAIACAQQAGIQYDGCYLLLQMPGSWFIQSAEFAVKPGYEYTADFMARKIVDNTDFNGYLAICFVDMFGIQLQADKVTVGKTYGEWTAEAVKAVAPEGATAAYLIFGIENADRKVKADYAIDDLVVTQSEEPVVELEEVTQVATEPVYEDKFEDSYTPEGSASSVRIPNGWTASQLSAAMSCSKYDNYDGTTNLCLQDIGDKWIRTPLFDATPGNVYTAIFVEKKLNPAVEATGGYVKIAFVDKDENIIEESVKAIGAASRWSKNGLSAQAPAGAVKFYVEFGLKDVTGSSPAFCVDNLQLIKAEGTLSAPDVEEPDDTTPEDKVPEDEDNAPTGDNAALMTASSILLAVVALAVLVIKKRRFF